jgi:hypothetical protein
MKVGKLREILDGLPYDTEIVINGRDHNYIGAEAEAVPALIEEYTDAIIEDFYVGTDVPDGYTKRITVLLVS